MYEREKFRSTQNLGARKIKERESANAKARNLKPKKERESASAKSSAKERESASAKRRKKRVPSSDIRYVYVLYIENKWKFAVSVFRIYIYIATGAYM